jgi:phosphoserine phosphatase RsbU/P
LLYTDGITEANDAKDTEFGEERLEEFLRQQRAATDQELIDRLLVEVLRFCGAIRPRDDMTLMVVSRRG